MELYQRDLEEKRAAKMELYQRDLEKKRAAQRELYQRDIEENRATKKKSTRTMQPPFWHLKDDGIGKTPMLSELLIECDTRPVQT